MPADTVLKRSWLEGRLDVLEGELIVKALRPSNKFLVTIHERLQHLLLPFLEVYQVENGRVLDTATSELAAEHAPQTFKIFDRIERQRV